MKTFLNLKNTHDHALPIRFRNDDVRFSSSLVKHFLKEFTAEGDVIFDPFAGFGTTLFVAQEMNRVPCGIEYDAERYDFIRQRIADDHIIHGDALRFAEYDLPEIDFSMTSPPYMHEHDTTNPFAAYKSNGDYETYLDNLQTIYAELAKKLKTGARAVIEVSNLKHESGVTPLAWHIAERVSEVLRFEGEVIACWDAYGYGYDHSYCLVFSKAT